MAIPLSQQVKVLEKIKECLCVVLGKDAVELVRYGLSFREDMGTVAGLAYPETLMIELNAQLFLANKSVFLDEIIPHETAHILQFILYPEAKKPHGKEWKKIMKLLGVNPDTYHDMDMSEIDNGYFRYTCGCKTHSLTKRLHKRTQEGQATQCVECNSRLVYFPRGDCYSNI